jgi:hypothetical protein
MGRRNHIKVGVDLKGLVRAASTIAQARRECLQSLRAALMRRNDAEALEFARKLCGLENDETSSRIDSSLH